ncbi:MAG TPA: DUF5818 domain-containing protein [Bryobacteraceae bacterium]|nr:DUF5818 domain-containing protein [Bryobacteraceae bacterium]
MTKFAALLALSTAAVLAGSYRGVITESMCLGDHKAMNMGPDPDCIRRCVKTGHGVKYVLWDGKAAYRLSHQQTPEKFAGRRVTITGSLYPKTGVLRVDRIDPLK